MKRKRNKLISRRKCKSSHSRLVTLLFILQIAHWQILAPHKSLTLYKFSPFWHMACSCGYKENRTEEYSLKFIVCYLMQRILNAAQCFPNWSSSSSRWFSKVHDGFSTERATVPKPRPSILQETSQDTYCSGQQSGICILFCNLNMKHEFVAAIASNSSYEPTHISIWVVNASLARHVQMAALKMRHTEFQ